MQTQLFSSLTDNALDPVSGMSGELRQRIGGRQYRLLIPGVAALLMLGSALPAAASIIPMTSTGNLGALNVSSGSLTFNTDTGIYYVNGVAQSTASQSSRWSFPGDSLTGPYFLPVFNFTTIDIGAGAGVTVQGASPLALLGIGAANIGGTFFLNGANGTDGGPGGGGGGGAGGGALAIFTDQALNFTGAIFANGGQAGTGDTTVGDPNGGTGGAGSAGGGTGGDGGASIAGGKGGKGGDGAVTGQNAAGEDLHMGGGGGGGGGAYNGPIGAPGKKASDPVAQPGGDGKCSDKVDGGKGGGGGGGTPPGGKGVFAGDGGGGGQGGSAPNGGFGIPGGDAAAGGGGGGGGGGGDACKPKTEAGTGGPGGKGGAGNANGFGGTGLKGTALGSPVNSGGGGGGGAVVMGSAADLLFYNGSVEDLGGSGANGTADGGLLVLDSNAISFGVNASFQRASLGSVAGFYTVDGITPDALGLSGGGAGAGGGGDGQLLGTPEPSPLVLLGIGILFLLTYPKRIRRQTARIKAEC